MRTIEAGDHTMIKCSACDRELLDIIHLDPTPDIEIKIKAMCPCGDYSFPLKVKGRFGHAMPIKDKETERTDLYIEDMIDKTDESVFVIREQK